MSSSFAVGTETEPLKPQEATKKRGGTKSRNGCITCKRRRYKCDETKPGCLKCSKRGIQCEGYAKNFKWRSFEEPKAASRKTKATFISEKQKDTKTVVEAGAGFDFQYYAADTFNRPATPPNYPYGASPGTGMSPTTFSHHQAFNDSTVETIVMEPVHYHVMAGSNISGVDTASSEQEQLLSPIFTNSGGRISTLNEETEPTKTEFTEPEFNVTTLATTLAAPDNQHISLSDLSDLVLVGKNEAGSDELLSQFDMHFPLYTYNLIDEASKLFKLYDSTCGIVSVKDGPTENPWRTLIWPLAQRYTALYHAVGAMTYFHHARGNQSMRSKALDHMKTAFSLLAKGMSDTSLPKDVALASTLSLALAQSWDTQISTGVAHLRGAALIMKELIPQGKSVEVPPWLKFLFNSWLYLDVCTRLTTEIVDEHSSLEEIIASGSLNEQNASESIDPLLGCAQELFPLIGKVAYLASRVRKSVKKKLNLSIVQEATVLSQRLKEWTPTINVLMSTFEDPACDLGSCIATAEAYRFAALLYLHQAVPEVPMLNSRVLAKKIMAVLDSIPETSRTCVVHIFPLLLASCDARGPREREWVRQRWDLLARFMWVGNVDRTVEVVREVWARKDVLGGFRYGDSEGALFSDNVLDEVESPAINGIKSTCHWSQVMKDWGWEVFLG